MVDGLKIDDYPRWDYYQDTAQLVFSDGEQADLVTDVEFVGTLSTANDTWMWSWANFNLLEPVCSRISEVRDIGEGQGFPLLTVPKWNADIQDGWHITAISSWSFYLPSCRNSVNQPSLRSLKHPNRRMP